MLGRIVNAEQKYLSPIEVSRALGVGVTTIKRWVDGGLLPAHKTAGGHRKLLMADVLRLVRSENFPHADLSRLIAIEASDNPDVGPLLEQFRRAVAEIDSDSIRAVIRAGYRSGLAVETIADRVISPGMREIGHDWETGKIDVMHEHRVTQACVSALYELDAELRTNAESKRPKAVGGAPEGDHYIMPSLLAKLTLLDAGWDAVNLGPHTPFSAFRAAIDEFSPRLIWLSVSHLTDGERLLREYRDFYELAEKRGIAVAIGGRGIADSLREQMPYTSFGDGLTHFAAFAKTLHRRPSRPRRGRPLPKAT